MSLLLAALILLQEKPVDELFEQLRSEKADVREDAVRRLRKAGASAVPRLKKGLEDKDAEVAGRCRDILDGIRSDLTAAEFKKIEQTLRRAKTIQIRFKLDSVTKTPAVENRTVHEGVVLLKEGNKLYLTGKNEGKFMNEQYAAASDGTRMTIQRGGTQGTQKLAVPDNLTNHLCTIVARSGPAAVLAVLNTPEFSFDEMVLQYRVAEFKELPADGNAKKMSYRLLIENPAAIKIYITLWYEPETFRLLKREFKIKFGDDLGEGNATETYEEFTLNADIPDGKFKLPEQK